MHNKANIYIYSNAPKIKHCLTLWFFTLMLVLGVVPITLAAVPQVVSYQGQLSDAAGGPVNGVVNITFNLYTVATGGAAVWTETQTSVNISKGLFKVDLGSVTPFPPGTFVTPVFLGVTVGTDAEMTPRTALTSVPFALHADDADTVGGFSPLQLDQSAHVSATNNPHHVTAVQVGADAAGSAATVQTSLNTHAANPSAHHMRYNDTEALAAVGTHLRFYEVFAPKGGGFVRKVTAPASFCALSNTHFSDTTQAFGSSVGFDCVVIPNYNGTGTWTLSAQNALCDAYCF